MYCKYCGKDNPDDSIFCECCGMKLNVLNENIEELSGNNDQMHKNIKSKFIAVAVVLAIVISISLFSLFKLGIISGSTETIKMSKKISKKNEIVSALLENANSTNINNSIEEDNVSEDKDASKGIASQTADNPEKQVTTDYNGIKATEKSNTDTNLEETPAVFNGEITIQDCADANPPGNLMHDGDSVYHWHCDYAVYVYADDVRTSDFKVESSMPQVCSAKKENDYIHITTGIEGEAIITVTIGNVSSDFIWIVDDFDDSNNHPYDETIYLEYKGYYIQSDGIYSGSKEYTVFQGDNVVTDYTFTNSDESVLHVEKTPTGKLKVTKIETGDSIITIYIEDRHYSFKLHGGPY